MPESEILKDIGARVKNKHRLVTTHWFNPPQLVPTVEIVRGEETSDDTVEAAYDLLTKIRKVPVKINRELPGFLVNRIQVALVREVLDLFEKGIASAEDIDNDSKARPGILAASEKSLPVKRIPVSQKLSFMSLGFTGPAI